MVSIFLTAYDFASRCVEYSSDYVHVDITSSLHFAPFCWLFAVKISVCPRFFVASFPYFNGQSKRGPVLQSGPVLIILAIYGYKRIRNRLAVKKWKTRHNISVLIRTFLQCIYTFVSGCLPSLVAAIN